MAGALNIGQAGPAHPSPGHMTRAEFIALSASMMILTALGIDIMLPAFGDVRRAFHLSPDSTETSLIIAAFFLGQVAQIVFGTVSDSWGRLAIMRVGFPLYIAGGLAGAMAPDLPTIYVARFVQGMGAAALFMITIACVRDRFSGDEMARTMSLVLTIFLFTPILAPFLGAALLAVSSWRIVFLVPPIFAVGVFVWSLRLEESLPSERRRPLDLRGVTQTVRHVLGNATFLRYVGVTTVVFSVFSSYLASSERIVGEIYRQPRMFAWIFAGTGALQSVSTFANSRLVRRFGARRSLRALLLIYCAVALALTLVILWRGDPPNMLIFFAGMVTLVALVPTIEPNSSALALEPLGTMAGTSAAIYGTTFFFVGSLAGTFVSRLLVSSVAPLAIGHAIAGVIALTLACTDGRRLR
jgi:MFS transporter, DHA1 family, multidrug resistance protein